VVLAVLAAVAILGAGEAQAATEIGDTCTASKTFEASALDPSPVLIFELTAPENALSLTAPADGVLTEWKVDSEVEGSFPETFKVVRPEGVGIVRVVAESPGTVVPGENVFPARIPVQAGDRLAYFIVPGSTTPLCEGESRADGVEDAAVLGSTLPLREIESDFRYPLSAVIEPDADGDGLGDETQDQCPASAATQGPCPVAAPSSPEPTPKPSAIALDASVTAGHRSVTVVITTNEQATVSVAGRVGIGKGKPVRLSGGSQVVAPGELARFVILLPKRLESRLKEMSPRHSLSLKLTATAPNAAGPPTDDNLKVRLKGQRAHGPHRLG